MITKRKGGLRQHEYFALLIDLDVDPFLIYSATRRGGMALEKLYDEVLEDCT